jgi:TonB family protein
MKALFATLFLLYPAPMWSLPMPQDASPGASTPTQLSPSRIRVGGKVMTAKIVEKTQPVYPPLARQTRIQGTVRLHAIVGTDGSIKQLEVLSGHPLLVQSALDAVRKWRYEPVLLNGSPVEVDTTIDVIYALNQDSLASMQAPVDPQLRADIAHLFEVIHFREQMAESGQKIFGEIRPMLLAMLPNTPNREKIADDYVKRLLDLTQTDDFNERVVQIYAKYFSDEDVKSITQFYETPTGQHFSKVMSDFLADLNQAGQNLAMENIPDILAQLCKQYPELEGTPKVCPNVDPAKKSKLLQQSPPRGSEDALGNPGE